MRDPLAPMAPSFSSNDVGATLFTDPLSDLLLSVAAIIVLAVIVVLPAVRTASDTPDNNPASRPPGDTVLTLRGQAIEPFFATQHGLRMNAPPGNIVPVDQILDDRQLAEKLRYMRDAGEPLLLIIEPDGFEAAFLFEATASLNGPKRSWQIRLDTACTDEKSKPFKPFCSSLASSRLRAR